MKRNFLITVLIILTLIPSALLAAETESEHPPLSDNTKLAIAAYKRKPSEVNRQALLSALEEAYDAVIEQKKVNLAADIENREETVKAWLRTALEGGEPPFLSISGDEKEAERAAVYEAIEAYGKSPSEADKAVLEAALTTYYDAFLYEQEVHVIETIELKEERLNDSLEYFTNEHFLAEITGGRSEAVAIEDTLAEIIASYISTGAQIVPVNPQARVRERTFNASIKSAQLAYLDSPDEEKLQTLRAALEEAFTTAYEVRTEEIAAAEAKGTAGVAALFAKLLEEEFIEKQYQELTEQRNLYGRIDRMVTFGTNTHGEWTPRLGEESEELYALLERYQTAPSRSLRNELVTRFYGIYNQMLTLQQQHIEAMQYELDSFIDSTLEELI